VAQNKRKGQPPKGGNQTAFYIVLGVIALAGIGAIFYAVRGGNAGGAATEPIALDITDTRQLYEQATPKRIGEDNAPVRIVVFSDFQCPACAQFAAFAIPYIKEQHVEPGTVRYVHYDFPLVNIHPQAFLAARAGRCAHEQGRFWEYHDLLYAEQQSWSRQEEAPARFVELAQQLGLERATFESCLNSDRYAAEVTTNMRLGQSLGVPGTPTLYVNGKRAEIRSLQALDRLIAEEAGQGN
jgi:protein-disulfide isomerase